VAACPACGKELPGEFPFCPHCGVALTEEALASALEERKVVSVLFCDLVGFTAASEAADPEDVRARLLPYHGRLREEIERFGGTVEKFVGDAVMAVFGAPVAHEDDAERAVRAGLRIPEAIGELNELDGAQGLQVRVGINTGEAVVALAARPELGEGMVTGDVVNTASRIQGVAPVDGVAVSEQTYRQTERVFDYETLEPVTVKGKPEPLLLYRPLRARADFGREVTRTHTTPLVGRDLERSLLNGTFDRAVQQRSCQLVTVEGEAGVGKSRLCMELARHVDAQPGLYRWRQGRCLPYGDGIAFWALGEIVKAECGILESDSPQKAESKLEGALPEDDPDRSWLRARLAPLVGLPAEPASQEESFTAWRRVLETWAAARETVLVFEDLHWADDALLAFLEHLADWAEGVPLLVLCTARPELYERHPTFGANARNAQRINLSPLTDDETARLIGSLLERAMLAEETQQALLERAGGNPLYAEEFVRLLGDRGLSEPAKVPDSVQALIAARLDTLSPERKSLLQDAAVVGKVFWTGVLAEMGGRDRREVEEVLHALARKELVRPFRTSSMDGEAEYGFWHVLVRDVCYQQIPRVGRAARHQAAAAWLEAKAGERVEDLADVLAYHFEAALELVRAAGHADDAAALEGQTLRYLTLAGERALWLDGTRAEQHLNRALELAPEGNPERAGLLERWAMVKRQQGRFLDARVALEQALDLYRGQNDLVSAGRILTDLTVVLSRLGDPRGDEMITEALELLEAQPPGPELLRAYSILAASRTQGVAAFREGMADADRSLRLAAALGLGKPLDALAQRDLVHCLLGERQGLEGLRGTLRLALDGEQTQTGVLILSFLAFATWWYNGPEAALEVARQQFDLVERRGLSGPKLTSIGLSALLLAALGQTDQALADARHAADRLEAVDDIWSAQARSVQLRLLTEQGNHDQAPPLATLITRNLESGNEHTITFALPAAARVLLAQGRLDEATSVLIKLDETPFVRDYPEYSAVLPELLRATLPLDNGELARRLVRGVEPLTPIAQHALTTCRAQLAEAAGERTEAAALYADAAERWHQFGTVPERAYALLGHGRSLLTLGHATAEIPLTEARDLFASMGYKPALAETEKLLEQALAGAS
jgi:class 3 adenylate cyclase/tetratricopeptide (TPR) repeat protein